jgi:hypothetical protein
VRRRGHGEERCWAGGRAYDDGVSSSAIEPVGADESLVRAHAPQLAALAARYGIRDLRFASAGRLVGRVDPDRDALDMAGFAAAAEELLGAEVSLFSEAVLTKPNVSADLVHAHAL